MTDREKEQDFENDIVSKLTQNNWEEGKSSNYNKDLALYPEDLIGFLKDTRPKEIAKLQQFYKDETETSICQMVAKQMQKHGALKVLREGVKDRGAKLKLCQFKPEHQANPDLLDHYQKNRLRVVRQLYYSKHNNNSFDLVLFVNGIPVATVELKSDVTQSIDDAVNQYKENRLPKDPKSNKEEPLLVFNKRVLVHFAVSSTEVYMTTKLAGKDTFFLPFNQGNNGGAGNPPNSDSYPIAYLWEKIWQKDAWLDILGRFIHLKSEKKEDINGKKTIKETLIFPRFHQWEAVTNLLAAVKKEKAGHTYLIQHSAGSGKSNSIAWTAHQLSALHDENDKKIFDGVIVVTDRTVLDNQLQGTISSINHHKGVIAHINRKDSNSKSTQLSQALTEEKAIIIVTIQTFPFVLDEIRKQKSLREKNFAIIADEAHSSQTGKAAKKLIETLTTEYIDENSEISAEDMLTMSITSLKEAKNISYFAFTATPKEKTIQLFGRAPNPDAPINKDNLPAPFHVYTMQQAIEEGFILDVLRNYTSYEMAYQLAHKDPQHDTNEIETKRAKSQIYRWLKLHPHNISQKVQIAIEHFRCHVAHLLNGQAKAMVVTGSRKEAVRYKQAFDAYIEENNYDNVRALVAFSGTVKDEDQEFSERSMNPGLNRRSLRKAFDSNDYQVMLVANKFQTGFDQPKLCAMYVDKSLGGVACVQTLSRLNRTYPGKNEVFILDFVNNAEEVRAAFEPYYRTAELTDMSDPNLVYDMQDKLNASRLYTLEEVDAFAIAFYDPKNKTQEKLESIIQPAVDRFNNRYKQTRDELLNLERNLHYAKKDKDKIRIGNIQVEIKETREQIDELKIFKRDLGSFSRYYEFVSQIIAFGDTDLEKLNIFSRFLFRHLKTEKTSDPINLNDVVLTHYRLSKLQQHAIKLEAEQKLQPTNALGSAKGKDPKKDRMSQIIQQINDLFRDADLMENYSLSYFSALTDILVQDKQIIDQVKNNPKDKVMKGNLPGATKNAIMDSLTAHETMATMLLQNEELKKRFDNLIYEWLDHKLKDAT
ncbi:type I restriction endonuclease subunit R [Candidatus Uabimicrobium amorphum]|uniref:Type I restriction-modification system, restriction subunit n=1 Tax=Uabimicrobium amorphum TaxID=2596890 RepID=A0A5S9F5Z7_UABAM|nr:type I restriction endonuclease [Candidatus Uabimicrobium amorphum]BBM86643.1 type I restriction-modification system, restriction subunit [Candidatus Uabimicrobium amorphum]